MQESPNRVISLLSNSDINLKVIEGGDPAPLNLSVERWCFAAFDNKIVIWIYKFKEQSEMDKIMSFEEENFRSKFGAIDFSQNGEFLMVVRLGVLGELPRDQYLVSSILQKFAGEVER